MVRRFKLISEYYSYYKVDILCMKSFFFITSLEGFDYDTFS